MTRNLKTLGLALAAVFAFGALAASSAMAEVGGQLTAVEPVTLTGEDTGEPLDNSLTLGADAIICNQVSYTGHKTLTTAETAEKTHELLPSGSTSATITPHYSECTQSGTARIVHVDMNGCDYDFHSMTKEGEHTYSVKSDVVCPAGQAIRVTVWSSTTGTKLCEATVAPQSNLEGLTITHNTIGDDLVIEGTVEPTTTRHGLCVFGGTPTGPSILHVDATVKGHNELGEPIGVTVTDVA